MTATRTMTTLPLCPLPVTPATQARAWVWAWTIAVDVCPRRLQRRHCHPRHRQWHQGGPPPPLTCCRCSLPPRHQCLLPRLPERCSPPRGICLGPPCRPSPLRAHQQCKLQVQQPPGTPLLHSGLPPLQLLLSLLLGYADNATTLSSQCRQVE